MKSKLEKTLSAALISGCGLLIFLLLFIFIFKDEKTSPGQNLPLDSTGRHLKQFEKKKNCERFLTLANNYPEHILDGSEIDFQNTCVAKIKHEKLLKAKIIAANNNFFGAAEAIENFFTLAGKKDELLLKFQNMYSEFDRQSNSELEEYDGPVSHIFFHSLIVYPQLAFDGDPEAANYDYWMTTADEFKKILNQLYENDYILIDIRSLAAKDPSTGNTVKNPIFLPASKKPLVISLDDINYFFYEKKDGFAQKMVFDENGSVATLVEDPHGSIKTTRDGDLVPILDDFVLSHPDFSFLGSKGILALTGFRGIFGYNTYDKAASHYIDELKEAKMIATELRLTGWIFASHSYNHGIFFKDKSISREILKKDMAKWQDEVAPISGPTNIFVGPYGQTFSDNDPRRDLLLENGYNILCGIDIKSPLYFYEKYFISDRIDIDGYRMVNNRKRLADFFDVASVYDGTRPVSIEN